MGRGQQIKGAGRGLDTGRLSGFGGFGGAGGSSSLSYLSEPPSFTAISDSNVVVSLKNVLKKDSTTKAKALDDLVSYAQAHPFDKDGGVEDGILDVWDQIYPRSSIDNSRRVRELSHTLQLELLKSTRKRMERHIPNIVGAWLAGLFDRDRVVARAAKDGLSSFLTTPDKVSGFWKKCQSQILAFASEAIQETQDTLSDERSTTKEDSEAKYFRVINASLSLVLSLLQRIEAADTAKFQADYDDYFSQDTVWKSITVADSSVRRTVCQLLVLCLDTKLPYADTVECRQAMITGGLKTPQTGSALEYVDALSKLTKSDPTIWKAAAKSKKSSVARLQAFVARGSQGSRAAFWEALDGLLVQLPVEALEPGFDSLLLESIKTGLSSREETRLNNAAAWKCFTDAAGRSLNRLDPDEASKIANEHLFPLIEQYLYPQSGKPVTGAGGPPLSSLKDIYLQTTQTPALATASAEEWNRLGGMLCTKLSASLPGVSKEYQSSQEKVGAEGKRWFSLVREILQAIKSSDVQISDQTAAPSTKIISQSISLLESRNMKPFGAARIIESALELAPQVFHGNAAGRTVEFLLHAAQDNMEQVIDSPSLTILLSCTNLIQLLPPSQSQVNEIWTTWTDQTLNLKPGPLRNTILSTIVNHRNASEFVQSHSKLQQEIFCQGLSLAKSASNDWGLFRAAVNHNGITAERSRSLSQQVGQILEEQASEDALSVLELLIRSMPELLSENDQLHTALVARLLSISEISGASSVSTKAAGIRSLLETHGDGKLPVVGIIQSNLEQANAQSLEIDTLVNQAKSACESHAELEDVFPSTNAWMQALSPFLDLPINPSLSITNIIGGAATLGVGEAEYHGAPMGLRVPRDKKGRSIPARMSLYVCAMVDEKVDISSLPAQFLVEILYLQCVTIQLISDQITSLDTNGLWFSLGRVQDVVEAEDLVSTLRSQLNSYVTVSEWWLDESKAGISAVVNALVNLLIQESQTLTPRAVYSSRALSELFQTVAEARGMPPALEEKFVRIDYLKTKNSVALIAAAVVTGFGQSLQGSKQINNFCNRLVSDAAGANAEDERTRTILVLTTLCSNVYEEGQLPVANNRIVFAVRQITSLLEEPEVLDARLSTDICKALTVLLPCMKDVYGSYWERTIEFLLHLWDRSREHPIEEAIPVIHASLKLAKVLENIPEANDDLVDALKDLQNAKPKAIVELLKLPRELSSQPGSIVDALLCREVDKIPVRSIPALDEIFPLMASDLKDIQTAAFSLLHRAIPEEQQQKSVDALLDKTDSRLPDELLSLLLDPPTLEAYPDEALSHFPIAIRCYLLSWKLVFDAFSTSSFKVRNDFTDNLKVEGYIMPLLDFTFDVLGHSNANPLNLDKENFSAANIYDYDTKLADAEYDERSMQWLLLHLYYLVLKYVPGLFRVWYLDCRSKQTRLAVESWTTKYYSPLIISDTLDEVQNWADTQEPPAADEQELLVKVSKAAKEVTAGYEVDESHATIVIKIPASYPIEGVTVNGLHRVAVTERKWKSWIMTTQGVITFSNGNIIDGLQVFKRNIVGALKGQSECAICYSIISTDKRMPDKRCTTCKNLFHRTCLYKWFQTSNQNTCPLCRNPIDYLGADTQKRRQ